MTTKKRKYYISKEFCTRCHYGYGTDVLEADPAIDIRPFEWRPNISAIDGVVYAVSRDHALRQLEAWERDNMSAYEVAIVVGEKFDFNELVTTGPGHRVILPDDDKGSLVDVIRCVHAKKLEGHVVESIDIPTIEPDIITVRVWSTSEEAAAKEAVGMLQDVGYRISFDIASDGTMNVIDIAFLEVVPLDCVNVCYETDPIVTAQVSVYGYNLPKAIDKARKMVMDDVKSLAALMYRNQEEEKE